MNLPTKITMIRLIMIPIIVACFCLQELWAYMFLVTMSLFVVASMTDYVDGYIARKYNMVTSLGKFLDPIADKVLVLAGLFIIVVGNYITTPYVAMICSVIILAREFIIGLFRQIAALKNFVLAADKLGKYKTTATMMALPSLMFAPFIDLGTKISNNAMVTAGKFFVILGYVLFIIATILTVVSGINYIVKNKELLKDGCSDKE